MTEQMMPSERSLWVDRVATEKQKADQAYHIAMRHCVEVINRSKMLSEEQKTQLLREIYK